MHVQGIRYLEGKFIDIRNSQFLLIVYTILIYSLYE